MKWLLHLYPARWRRRYGAEIGDLIASRPFSLGTTIDLLAGAVDAWTHPELIAQTSKSEEEAQMIAKTLQLRCAGYGRDVTPGDKVKSVMVMLGGALTLSLLLLWARQTIGGGPYLVALLPMAYLWPYLVSMRYTSLKGRSTITQAIVVVAFGSSLAMLLLLAAWISTRI